MVKEQICLDVLRYIRDKGFALHDGSCEQTYILENTLYKGLLPRYSLEDLEAALRWLGYGEYVGIFEKEAHGAGNQLSRTILIFIMFYGHHVLTQDGFSEEDKILLHQQEQPYSVFIAHQFVPDDKELVDYIQDRVLKPVGLTLVSGKADGLEQFRDSILEKIRKCRFFLCLLTKRVQLSSGGYASSTWLYQETGAALAFGKKPLLLVEEGIEPHYVGEFQKVYEHIVFTRSNHPRVFEGIARRFLADLDDNKIPRPTIAQSSP